jgi:hypothetical protein
MNFTYEEPHNYIPGDPYVICDRCGRKLRKSASKKTWDNLVVCPNDWEPRHPQELIHDTPADRQVVMDARPRPATVSVSASTTIGTAGNAGDSTITVVSISGMSDTQQITIELDNGNSQITTINGTPSGTTVTLTDKLTGSVAVGNYVVVSTTGTTQSDL